MLETLDAAAVRRFAVSAADALAEHRAEIDELNVFPVPDADTGTNVAVTLRAGADALAVALPGSAADALAVLADAAARAARGNSGLIASQVLRGLAERAAARCTAGEVRAGLRRGAELAYAAVAQPVEGTMLTVARAAADAAESAPDGGAGELAAVLAAAVQAAAAAVRATPQQLAALARAGVVDAGGQALLVLLDALAVTVGARSTVGPPRRAPRRAAVLRAAREDGSPEFEYEVQYLLYADDRGVTALRGRLAALGDSLAVVGAGDGRWNVHVHVNDAGAAIEAGVEAGRPERITVVRFAEQAPPARPTGSAVVAVAPGEGLAHLFQGEGVLVVDGAPDRAPSPAAVLDAVRASCAGQVVLLPNAEQVRATAEAAARRARDEGTEVAVVPTRSPVQGLAAVAVHDPGRRFGDDVIAMAEAAAATRYAEVTVARREALTTIGRCQPGDVLGLIDGEVVEIGPTVRAVATAVVDRLLGVGGELMTLVTGRDADPGDVAALRAHLTAAAPLLEVTVFDGGQPHDPLLIGLE